MIGDREVVHAQFSTLGYRLFDLERTIEQAVRAVKMQMAKGRFFIERIPYNISEGGETIYLKKHVREIDECRFSLF